MFSKTSDGGVLREKFDDPETELEEEVFSAMRSRVRHALSCRSSISGRCFLGRPRFVVLRTIPLYPPMHIPR